MPDLQSELRKIAIPVDFSQLTFDEDTTQPPTIMEATMPDAVKRRTYSSRTTTRTAVLDFIAQNGRTSLNDLYLGLQKRYEKTVLSLALWKLKRKGLIEYHERPGEYGEYSVVTTTTPAAQPQVVSSMETIVSDYKTLADTLTLAQARDLYTYLHSLFGGASK